MSNINFVPDDYVRNNESQRTNLLYIVLFLIVMAGLSGSFVIIKMKQQELSEKEKQVNIQMNAAQEQIKKFERLQTRRKDMMKTALTTTELLEPVPKSVLLASLTNHLPVGMSLIDLSLIQKKIKNPVKVTSKYSKSRKKGKSEDSSREISPEKLLETYIEIVGIAPSDLQVAAYIERLSGSPLLNKVALVESKERKIDQMLFREFKLSAILRKDARLTDADIKRIRSGFEPDRQAF